MLSLVGQPPQLCADIQLDGVDAVLSIVVHEGTAATRGPLVARLVEVTAEHGPATDANPSGTRWCGTVEPDRTPGTETATWYLEVHTRAHPGGAVRGKLDVAER